MRIYPVSKHYQDIIKTNGDKLFTDAMVIYYCPMFAIAFMHCKNIDFQTTEPSKKLQKARERRGKIPLFTFRTLEIKPMTRILKDEGESETKGLKYALHICRGHFKDFSKGSGLGRSHAKGLYWWDSQVRGDVKIGAVIKDYKVTHGENTKNA